MPGNRVQTRQLGRDVDGRGADGRLTDAVTTVEIMSKIEGGETMDSTGWKPGERASGAGCGRA